MAAVHPSSDTSIDDVLAKLKSLPTPLLPPGKLLNESLRAQIADLQVHPALEALFHILNHDLPSAHFLVRHMQSPPAYEGMYIHGILHRIEGDLNNTRAWYADVDSSDVFENFWGKINGDKDGEKMKDESGQKMPKQDGAREFLDAVEKVISKGDGDVERLRGRSKAELDALLEWCLGKFGREKVLDARTVWVGNSEEIREMHQSQTSTGKGHRDF